MCNTSFWLFPLEKSFVFRKTSPTWCWLNGYGGGLGIQGSWVQIPLGCWINTKWGWLCLSSFWGRQNEYQLACVLRRSCDPPRIVPNSQGDCLGSTNALHRVWHGSQTPWNSLNFLENEIPFSSTWKSWKKEKKLLETLGNSWKINLFVCTVPYIFLSSFF